MLACNYNYNSSTLHVKGRYDKITFMLKFLKEVRGELEKVTFPSRKEIVRLTGVVIFISVFVGVFIGVSDLLFTKVLELIIK